MAQRQYATVTPAEIKRACEKKNCERSLYEFVKRAWSSINSAPFEESWAVEALCLHLEAVTRGEVKRFLANYPPRCSKTIVTSVCWPIWTWLQKERSTTSGPGVRFLCASYNDDLSRNSADKMRSLINSPWFQARWGDRIKIRKDKDRKSDFANEQGGGRISTSMKGGIIGRGGDIIMIDDPHNTQTAESDADRLSTLRGREWWQYWPPVDYPQYKDTARNKLPPISFALASLDTAYGDKEENSVNALTIWGLWQHATSHDAYVIAANDGQIMRLPKDERPKVCLMYAWTKKLPINGEDEERPDFDDDGEPLSDKAWNSGKWLERRQKKWGLVEWVVYSCKLFKVDLLLIEDKTRGKDVLNEIMRLHSNEDIACQLHPVDGDKTARLYRVQPIFSKYQVYAPTFYDESQDMWVAPSWATKVIDAVSIFPKGKQADADLVDTTSQALGWLRDRDLLKRNDEAARDYEEAQKFRPRPKDMTAHYEGRT